MAPKSIAMQGENRQKELCGTIHITLSRGLQKQVGGSFSATITHLGLLPPGSHAFEGLGTSVPPEALPNMPPKAPTPLGLDAVSTQSRASRRRAAGAQTANTRTLSPAEAGSSAWVVVVVEEEGGPAWTVLYDTWARNMRIPTAQERVELGVRGAGDEESRERVGVCTSCRGPVERASCGRGSGVRTRWHKRKTGEKGKEERAEG